MPARILALLVVLVLLPIPAARAAPRTAEDVLAGMSLAQRVGQLLMVGSQVDHASAETLRAISKYHVGNVILVGNTTSGRGAVARTVRSLQGRTSRSATAGVDLLVAVDQEGGNIQHLRGPGFATMPSALAQGRWSPARLRRSARSWGTDLRKAGVNLDLAPVADTVPRSLSDENAPIGHWKREFGHRPVKVSRHVTAFVQGMASAGVATSAKHFPGLGRVTANTDDTETVVDHQTRRDDPYLRPFAAAVGVGVPMVMISLASYPLLDPDAPAVFSHIVVSDMLRGDLGFGGVVVSDSLIADAVDRWSPGERAVRFVEAGGDLVLVTSPGPVRDMYAALLKRARTDPAFRARVEESALRILRLKQSQGLL